MRRNEIICLLPQLLDDDQKDERGLQEVCPEIAVAEVEMWVFYEDFGCDLEWMSEEVMKRCCWVVRYLRTSNSVVACFEKFD